MSGVSEPTLLLKTVASPHTVTMTPSMARELARANVVVWVGPEMEAFLADRLAPLAPSATLITLANLKPAAEGNATDNHAHDPHQWLDPRIALRWVTDIERGLIQHDPANAERYQTNGANLRERLIALDRKIAARLSSLPRKPYLVFHDAYHYFEARYELAAVGAIRLDPTRAPGPKTLSMLKQRSIESGVVCLFHEPQFDPKQARSLFEDQTIVFRELDPIGAGLMPGPNLYFELLTQMAEAFADCFRD
jgi:zinc transport system substrate-binding protein